MSGASGIRIVDMPDLGIVSDASSVVGEHAGSGRFASTALRDYVTSWVMSKLFVSVKSTGAVGDGVTDDTAAIQSALTAASGAGGGAVFFPFGTYYVAGALTSIGGVWLFSDGATLLGPTSGTTTMLTVSNVNPQTPTDFTRSTSISGLTFRVRGNYVALQLQNPAAPSQAVASAPVIEKCHFTSVDYTTAGGTGWLLVLKLAENIRVRDCLFQTYCPDGLAGINNALVLTGCANNIIEGCIFQYCKTAIVQQTEGTQISQGNRLIGCSSNGCVTSHSSSGTNDCTLAGCLFDNHRGLAISSTNDLGLSIDNCYLGSSYAPGPLVNIGVSGGSPNSAAHLSNVSFVPYVSMTSVLNVFGVSTSSYYNNVTITGCQFRNCNLATNVVATNYVAHSSLTGCNFDAPSSGLPISIANLPALMPNLRAINNSGLNPWGTLGVSGGYPAPTPLVTVGTAVSYQNPYPFDCMVYVSGGTLTSIGVNINGRAANYQNVTSVAVPNGATCTVVFTGSPTWSWFGI